MLASDWYILHFSKWCPYRVLYDWMLLVAKNVCGRYYERFGKPRGERYFSRINRSKRNQGTFQQWSKIFYDGETVECFGITSYSRIQCVVMIKREFICDFFIKSDRLVEEFNTNFQILITGIYVWIRLTVWSSIITLIYQLVEYYFETNCMNMYCQGASFPKEIGALEMINIHLILICLWEWKFSFGVIDKVTLVVLSSSLRCDLPRFRWWLILNLNWNFFFTFSRPTTIPYQSSWFER